MSSGVVFYGWFFANIRYSLLRIIIVVILTGMGFSLIYKGYHYPVDIIASITIGIMVIAVIYSLTKEEIIQKYPYMFGAFLWLLTVPMVAYLKIIEVNCLAWIWTVFWGLLGFTISWGLFYKYFDLPQSKLNRFINLTIIVASVALIEYINYLFKQYLGYKFYLTWFLVGLSFPLSVRLCHIHIRSTH
ncbi:phosphatase PAP2 family protein [Rickettsia hoogstraalii]|uniref:phosphatase PAP2 family protein n=1 Tax=Rickettsia hoogstraalii TaxID=467174 RepID=UPI00224C83E1|nr:phosphatase PAP2 family protein [Rickettsia hoogstraalii]MCX4083810.1 phosphatase PAP2 family protein [Rickettsia hoogstraalii]